MSEDNSIVCSFCGRPQSEAVIMITNANAFICEACVVLCYEVLRNRIEGMLTLRKLPEDLFFQLRELEASGLSSHDLLRKIGLPKGQSAAWWLTDMWRAIEAFLSPTRMRRITEWQIGELEKQKKKESNKNRRAKVHRRIRKLKNDLSKLHS